MRLVGRREESERIAERVRRPGPSLTLVSGPRRSGRTTLLQTALGDAPGLLWYRAAPLPDPDHRALFAARLERFVRERAADRAPAGRPAPEVDRTADWPELFRMLAENLYAYHGRTTLVLDDWHHLVSARSRIVRHLTEFWLDVRRRGIPLHLILSALPGDAVRPLENPDEPLARWKDEHVRLGPLPYRDVTGLFAGRVHHRDRLAAYGVFGGWPDVVRHVEPGRSLASNILGAVLRPDAPLLDWGTDRLVRDIQAPGRYASILRALAGGARSWGEIRDRVPDLTSSGQMAPYMQRLEELGIVEVSRSLDASPNSRSRRYRIVDPFTSFWFRFVLPNRTDLDLDESETVWSDAIRPALDDHLSRTFPRICRQWIEEYAGDELSGHAREVGGLWGSDYDVEVAGTLTDGAVFYGRTLWDSDASVEATVRELDRQAEKTRYGFGRNPVHRLVFTDRTIREPADLPEIGGDRMHLLDARILVGS